VQHSGKIVFPECPIFGTRGSTWHSGNIASPVVCLAACCGHPSIVQIKDVATNEETGELFIVMELVSGGATGYAGYAPAYPALPSSICICIHIKNT
jgi:serine/threonine protein kinase